VSEAGTVLIFLLRFFVSRQKNEEKSHDSRWLSEC